MTPLTRPKRRVWRRLLAWGAILAFGVCTWGTALAAGGGKPATKLVQVADTRMMSAGFARWTADIYNSSHWLFAGLVVSIMAGMGLILGFGCDRLIGLLGIKLGKLDHHE